MRRKNQIKVKEISSSFPNDGTNWYREIKKIMKTKSLTPERASDVLKVKVILDRSNETL